jgi:hypothetical protein
MFRKDQPYSPASFLKKCALRPLKIAPHWVNQQYQQQADKTA